MTERVSFSREASVFAEANRAFLAVSAELSCLLPDATIDHIGSTSVPHSLTKGDLDIGVGVEPGDFERCAAVLEQHFAIKHPADRTSDLCAFEVVGDSLPIGIQLYAKGSIVERRFIEWRDALQGDTQLLESYNALKARFQGGLMSEYRLAKSQFIRAYLGED